MTTGASEETVILKSRGKFKKKKKNKDGAFEDFPNGPMVKATCSQLGLPGSIPDQRTRSHMLQLRPGGAK